MVLRTPRLPTNNEDDVKFVSFLLELKMSDSDSDSEGDKIRRTKRSVIVKFNFDDSDSSSSESEGPCARPSTSKRTKKLSSSEGSSGGEGRDPEENKSKYQFYHRIKKYLQAENDSSDDSWCPEGDSRPSTSQPAASAGGAPPADPVESESSDSDSSDASAEKCPICLHTFREQEIGTPNICEHSFCAPCIKEWSSNVQTCPIDRRPFTSIRIRSRYADGTFVRELPVEAKVTELRTEFDFTNCEVCHMSDREESMLLCDSCNGGYHMECLVPPLTEVPAGAWYCDCCFASESSGEDETRLLEELRAEIGSVETRLRVHRAISPGRQIPRTRQSERIRATIRNRRRDDTETADPAMPGTKDWSTWPSRDVCSVFHCRSLPSDDHHYDGDVHENQVHRCRTQNQKTEATATSRSEASNQNVRRGVRRRQLRQQI